MLILKYDLFWSCWVVGYQSAMNEAKFITTLRDMKNSITDFAQLCDQTQEVTEWDLRIVVMKLNQQLTWLDT